MKAIDLVVNAQRREVMAEPERSLLRVLREDLELTGTKYGCGEAQCGACTVLRDGQPIRSCITEVGEVSGKAITTIEGVETNGRLHPVQEAFLAEDAMQCGYCIPGMIMSGVGLLNRKPRPTEAEILQAMEGNICRCGTYPRILAAMKRASGSAEPTKGGAE